MANEGTKVRNVVLVGHGGAGKTTLMDRILACCEVVKKPGSVDDGSSLSDFDPEEKERKVSIDPAVFRVPWKGTALNVIDAPGYPDFVAGAIQGLAAVEAAVIVVSAADGVQLNTRKMWERAGEAGLARILVINKVDNDHALADLPAQIQEAFGAACVQFNVPDGTGSAFSAVRSCLAEGSEERDGLVESIVETDDTLMEKYLEDSDAVAQEEIEAACARAVTGGTLAPIVWTSGRTGVGVPELLELLAKLTPAPETTVAGRVAEGDAPAVDGPFTGQVFRVFMDPFVGKVAFIRVYTGSMAGGGDLKIKRTGKSARVGGIAYLAGKEQENAESAAPGDIVAVAKIEDLAVGDTVGDGKWDGSYKEIKFPTPMVALAVAPKAKGDEQKISGALARIADSDPTFVVSRDRQTGDLVVTGTSQLHLEVMLGRMRSRFGVDVETRQPKVPYLETITTKGEAKYRHKKQTGGAGQFAEVWLRVEPMERGAGFEFGNEIFGGAISQTYIPSVEKGVRQAMEGGVLAGYPVVDVKAVVYDGKEHPVDSKDIAFQIAGRAAFREAAQAAKAVLLEPVVQVEVTAPTENMGDVMGSLNGKRGRVQGMDSAGTNMQNVQALVPMSEMMSFSSELKAMTGGQASFSMEFSHYDPVPHRVAEAIIAQAQKKEDED
jgi:elongation factor G